MNALREVLAPMIERRTGARVVELRQRPSPYRTSFAVDELDVLLDDGRMLEILFKDVGPTALATAARRAKPRFLYHPLREIRMYRNVLDDARLGTAFWYGASVRRAAPRYWLFIERVAGVELYQVGDFDVWRRIATWLAAMHQRFRGAHALGRLPAGTLIEYDELYYRRWLRRARAVITTRHAWLLERYERAIDELLALPRTIIHGEFYPSNIIVQAERVCPVDWEMAAHAPPLMDLAAFIAGRWSDHERQSLVSAYFGSSPESAQPLNACRLHVAIQWLAWSQRWAPPASQEHDWLSEASLVARELAA